MSATSVQLATLVANPVGYTRRVAHVRTWVRCGRRKGDTTQRV